MTLLGTGTLTWFSPERKTDRYGLVCFTDRNSDRSAQFGEQVINEEAIRSLQGKYGTLKATVVEARKSTHIGDLFHGVFPSMPDVGEILILGTGYFANGPVGFEGGTAQVGVQPADKRSTHWMDIRALYRAHEQTVMLTFEECPEGTP